MLPWKLRKRQILLVNQNLQSVYFSLAIEVSACELQPFSCHDLANDIYSQNVKTVFSHLKVSNIVTCSLDPQNLKLY